MTDGGTNNLSYSFDVVREPWIPTRDLTGAIAERGILDTILCAHELTAIEDPSPPIEFGLYRLLVAFVTDAFEITKPQQTERLLETGAFNAGQFYTYVQRCGNCFDLFDRDRPFLQVAIGGDNSQAPTSVAALFQQIPSGTNADHFHHGPESEQAVSPAVCARGLTAIAPFMTAGGQGKSPSINGIPPWYVLVRGDSLFQTLVLNCCVLAMPWAREGGTPCWRSTDPVTPKKQVKQFSLLQGLTWQSRAVQLIAEEGGLCTYSGNQSGTLVRKIYFGAGLRAVVEGGRWIDPNAAYFISERGRKPLRPEAGKPLWRDTGPIALLRAMDFGDDARVGDLPIDANAIPPAFRRAVSQPCSSLRDLLVCLQARCASWLDQLQQIIDDHFLALPGSPDRSQFPREAPTVQDIVPLCEYVQRVASIDTPFFLLLDEANELSESQQLCVNTLLAYRSQRTLCVKVASQLHGFKPHYRHGGTAIDETHDYTTLDLESLYTNHQEAYYQRVRAIADHRLRQAGLTLDIDDYIPPNPNDLTEMEQARRIAEERYLAIPEGQRPADRVNFIKKYAPAIVFQEIRSPKAAKSYAGFDNVVHLSSGIVRAFLDCCSRMYTKCIEGDPTSEPTQIPISIQNDVIAGYSDEFVKSQLVNKIESLDPSQPERADLESLHRLLKGLGALFRERLLDTKSREPRVISVSLKTDPDSRLRRILNLAEREAFLHRKWYRSKRGNINLPCYVLNRRLCPHFNLDLSGFQGRLEISAENLVIALSEPTAFVEIMRRSSDERDENSGQLALFEW